MICGAIFRDSTRMGPEGAKDRRCTLDASHRSKCDHDGPPVEDEGAYVRAVEADHKKSMADSLKNIASALRASLLQQATAHGVSMSEEQASAIANNMTNVAIEAVQDEFGSSEAS